MQLAQQAKKCMFPIYNRVFFNKLHNSKKQMISVTGKLDLHRI